jgi:tRNA 2-selenouridine synthase
MPDQQITIRQLQARPGHFLILDVRSPAEYAHAHIPGAFSLPLFSDDERARVGTAYKQISREEAIKTGLGFFGPRMKSMVEEAERLLVQQPKSEILVHCWRGGMRSEAVAWLLDLYGLPVSRLSGGYKSFRGWVLEYIRQDFPLRVLGGNTGTGKTAILHALAGMGEDILDLEELARHRGSAFGGLGMPAQPSPEMLENQIAWSLNQILAQRSPAEAEKPIWMEDESQRIGQINQPYPFYRTYRSKPLLFLEVPAASRLDRVLTEYGHFPTGGLLYGLSRIQKRLGGPEYRQVEADIVSGNLREAFAVLLAYYDRYYLKSTDDGSRRVIRLPLPETGAQQQARYLIDNENIWKQTSPG